MGIIASAGDFNLMDIAEAKLAVSVVEPVCSQPPLALLVAVVALESMEGLDPDVGSARPRPRRIDELLDAAPASLALFSEAASASSAFLCDNGLFN